MKNDFALEAIEDVNQSAKNQILSHWKITFLPFAALFILGIFIVNYLGNVLILGVSFIWVIGRIALVYSRAKEEFMRQFARANNFAYIGAGLVEKMQGVLFTYGRSQSITHLIEGAYKNHKISFFFYSYVTGSGKHKQTHNYSVAEIEFKGNSPDIVVNSKDDWDMSSYTRPHHKQLPIESVFAERFAIFAPTDFEIETLELFTPDVLSELIKRATGYNLEFINNKLLATNSRVEKFERTS